MRDVAVAGSGRTQVVGHMTGADDDFRLVLIVANGVAAIEARLEQQVTRQRRRPLRLHDERGAESVWSSVAFGAHLRREILVAVEPVRVVEQTAQPVLLDTCDVSRTGNDRCELSAAAWLPSVLKAFATKLL